MTTPPYGHVITFLCTRPNSSLGDAPETKSIRRKGPQEAGVKAAKMTSGFREIVSVEPITAESAPKPRARSARIEPPPSMDDVLDSIQTLRRNAAALATVAAQRREAVEAIHASAAAIMRYSPNLPHAEFQRIVDRCDRLKELFNMEELESWKITLDRAVEAAWHHHSH